MKSKQIAQNEIARLRKLIAIKDREVRRWTSPDRNNTDLARFELKRIRAEIREYRGRIDILETM